MTTLDKLLLVLTLVISSVSASAAPHPTKAKNFIYAGQELGVSTFAQGQKQLQAKGTVSESLGYTIRTVKSGRQTVRYLYAAGTLARITILAPAGAAQDLYAKHIKSATPFNGHDGVYIRGNGQVELIQHSAEKTAEVVFSTSAPALDTITTTQPAQQINWLWGTLGVAALLIVAALVPVKSVLAKAEAVPASAPEIQLRTLEESLDIIAQCAPAMLDALQYRSAAGRPGARKWTAAIEAARLATAGIVAAASWSTCVAASEFVARGPASWTAAELVPVRERPASHYVYTFAAIVLPASLLIYCGLESLWWLLLAGPVAVVLYFVLMKQAASARMRANRAERQRTLDLYDRVVSMRERLSMSRLQYVTPLLVQALADRYTADLHLHLPPPPPPPVKRPAAPAVSSSNASTSGYAYAAAGASAVAAAGWDSSQAYAAPEQDYSAPAYVAPEPEQYEWPEEEASAYGGFNCSNGLPMIEGTPFDVGGNVYGSDSNW